MKKNKLKIPIKDRVCCICGKNTTTIDTRGVAQWRNIEDKPCCLLCWNRKFRYPIYNPIRSAKWNPIHNPRKLRFKDKRPLLQENPRKGLCELCGKIKGDTYTTYEGQIAIVKSTHIHHIEYHEENPLKDTIELCHSCHTKETWRLRKEKLK